jgi:LysR family transcriptional regulator, glycine cleavage system transcriptional activator
MKKSYDTSSLPSMTALRTFEVAARLGSFASAAEELHLTPSAVSHQIREFEVRLGAPVFRRERNRVYVTGAGRHLLPTIQRILHELTITFSEAQTLRNKIRVTALPSLLQRWLIPRLDSFSTYCPGADLQFVSSQSLHDLHKREFDLALRFGDGDWKGLHALKLGSESLVAVASPKLVGVKAVDSVGLLKRFSLLRDDHHAWDTYFQNQGINSNDFSFGARFSDSGLVLDSAEEGHGIALGRTYLASDAIKSGKLVSIGLPPMQVTSAYYILSAISFDRLTSFQSSFVHWLQNQFSGQLKPT